MKKKTVKKPNRTEVFCCTEPNRTEPKDWRTVTPLLTLYFNRVESQRCWVDPIEQICCSIFADFVTQIDAKLLTSHKMKRFGQGQGGSVSLKTYLIYDENIVPKTGSTTW